MNWPFLASDPVKISSVKLRSSLALLLVFGSIGFSCQQSRPYETKLVFGRRIGDTALVSDSAWNVFVKEVIIPRFPSGFTIDDVNGYYRMGDGHIINEPSKVLLVIEERDPDVDSVYDAITAEYIRRFHQESVLKLETPIQYEFESGK